jgi:hypothetical protein
MHFSNDTIRDRKDRLPSSNIATPVMFDIHVNTGMPAVQRAVWTSAGDSQFCAYPIVTLDIERLLLDPAVVASIHRVNGSALFLSLSLPSRIIQDRILEANPPRPPELLAKDRLSSRGSGSPGVLTAVERLTIRFTCGSGQYEDRKYSKRAGQTPTPKIHQQGPIQDTAPTRVGTPNRAVWFASASQSIANACKHCDLPCVLIGEN